MQNVMVISSDGHAVARMADYRPYMDPPDREEFDQFLSVYRKDGSQTFDPTAMLLRTDPDVVDAWKRDFIDEGRMDGDHDPALRLKEMEREGVVAEVIFPDFGLPFELRPPFLNQSKREEQQVTRTPKQVAAGNRAHNRWLADFCASAPERFAGLAVVDFLNVDAAVAEIATAKRAGLKGVVLPYFTLERPLYHPRYEPIWQVCEDLQMPLASHSGMSGIFRLIPDVSCLPHEAMAHPIYAPFTLMATREILRHMIWGGVLERHPTLKLVLTEQGSGWVLGELAGMDHSYERSFLRRDVRDQVKVPPSDYFKRQCFLGASLISAAEVEARNQFGVDKLLVGVDYPHHEGTWQYGTQDMLKAIFGSVGVPVDDARCLLGENAAAVYGFDVTRLAPLVQQFGPTVEDILTEPSADLLKRLERGDLHKPLGTSGL